MGLTLWALETLAVALASYAAAARFTHVEEVLDRAMLGLVFGISGLLGVLYVLGSVNAVRPLPVAALAGALSLGVLAASLRGGRGSHLTSRLRWDLKAPARLLRTAHAEGELAVYVLAPAMLAVALSLFIAWRFPSWSWDCVWYHVSISDYVLQTHGNGWVDTNVHYVNGYPRNVELLSVWNSVLLGNTRLDDGAQFPFAALGALGIASFCRRLGVRPGMSTAAGAMWLLSPAVCLQLHTTHADLAAGALFITSAYFLTAPVWRGRAQALTFLCFGLYAGSKVTGLFHALLLGPLLLARVGAGVLASTHRPRAAAALLLQVGACVALGGFSYGRDLLRFGNPFWPVKVVLPFFGELRGIIDPHDMAWPPAFFGAPGAFTEMLRHWYTPSDNYYPDVREGPFGILFAWLTLPCFVLFALQAPFRKQRWHHLAVVGLGVLAVLVPVAWWGRYTLGICGGALIAFAFLHAQLSPYLRPAVSAFAVWLSIASYAAAVPGYHVLPTPFADERVERADQVRLRTEIDWLWPEPAAYYRDHQLQPGDVIVYDDSVSFLGEFWAYDLRNRAVFVKDSGDDAAYLQRLRELRPVWVTVGEGSRGQAVLQARPGSFRFIFPLGRSGARMYVVLRRDF